MIGKLEHGMYWHIPRADCILRLDEENKRFVIVHGKQTSRDLKTVKQELLQIGYGLITRDDEAGIYSC